MAIKNPWISVLFKPAATIKAVEAARPYPRLLLFYALFGIPLLLNMAQRCSLGKVFGLPSIVLGAIVLGLIFGFIALSTSSGLFYVIGKWFKGKASFEAIQAVVAWAVVPNIFLLLGWIVLLFTMGSSAFMSHAAVGFFPVLRIVVGLWSLIIFILGLAAVQQYSLIKAIITMVIPIILAFIIGTVIAKCAGIALADVVATTIHSK